jgi:MFS family permease
VVTRAGSARPIWRVAGIRELAAVSFIGFTGVMVLLPVAPLWAVHGGAGTAGSGLVNGVMLAVTVLTQLLVPRALARFGWSAVLTTGMVALGVPAVLLAISDALPVVLVLSGARGVGFGVLTVTGSSAVAWLVEPARRGEGIGFYGLSIALPNLLILPIGPWIAVHAGYPVTFVIGALPLLGVLPARRLAHAVTVHGEGHDTQPANGADQPGHEVAAITGARSTWVDRVRLLRPMLLLLSVTLTGGALLTFMPQMVSRGAITPVALLVMGLLAAVARWRVGPVADRHGADGFLWPLLVLTVAGTVLAAWAVSDVGATRVWALLLGVAVVGVGYGAVQNLTLVVSFGVVPPARRDLASSTWNVGFDAGTGLGSIAVGAIAGLSSFRTAMLVAAAVTVVVLPLAWWRPFARPVQRPPACRVM